MAHYEQSEFCMRIRDRWPHLFENKRVLDCGSLDINGNNRHLFTGGLYLGIDIINGPNVDTISLIHEYDNGKFDVVISTECFEHDSNLDMTLSHITKMISKEGLFLFTCATTGRHEHGTIKCEPSLSPGTNHYYKNVVPEDVIPYLEQSFRCWGIEIQHTDLYGWGLDPL